MGVLKGSISILTIAIWTFCVCVPLYGMGFLRMLTPRGMRHRWALPMDFIIDLWVSWISTLIKTLRLVQIDLAVPDSLNDRNRWYVVVCNHQSWADILILQSIFRHRLPVLKFFTKHELIWVPLLGIAMWLLGFPYVRRSNSQESRADLKRREQNATTMQESGGRFLERPIAALNFLEGTRFTLEKKKRLASVHTHLLNPKTGGITFVLELLERLPLKVVDVTIVYENGAPSFSSFLCGRCPQVNVDVRQVDTPLDTSPEAVRDWVGDLWRDKDRRIVEILA